MKKKDTTENKNLWRWNSNLVPMTQDHDPSTHEPNSANAAWSAGSIRPTSSNISLCSLLKKFEYLSYYWAYLMIKMMMMMMMIMMMMIMMTMVFFFGNGWLTKDVKLFFPARMIAAGFSASQTCDTPRKGFSPAQNLSLGSVEWSCTVVIIATPIFQIKRHHLSIFYFI